MRFAISAVAAVSGLFLLALAFYGQPAVYLQEARDQWDQLMDRPIAHTPAVPYGNSEERAAQTRQDAAPLNEELAERQETAQPQTPEAALSAPPVPASGPRAASPSLGEVAPQPTVSTPPPPVASASPPPQPEASRPTPPAPAVGSEPPPAPPAISFPPQGEAGMELATVPPEPVEPNTLKLGHTGSEQTKSPQSQPAPEQPKSEPPKPGKSQQARPEPPKPEAVKHEQAKFEPLKPEPSKSEQAKSEPPKSEPKPTVANKTLLAQKAPTASPPLPQPPVEQQQQPLQQQPPSQPPLQLQALSRQQPLPPPPPQSSPSRQEGDDTQSVLARLRQLSPSTATAPQANTSPAPDTRLRQTSSSPLPRLNSARVALAGGQIEDARRLLQQVQLQLVFGPVDGPVDAPQAAAKGAMDVARALDALSANDVSLSRRYIDVAVGDLSGNPTNPPIQQSDRRLSGYAPAYPPR